ncbi:MAG: penicillin-binding protein 2 [Bacteroidia bacterium]|nr:penicillin-binding protein 2 [Bacteroidia bacterium]
MNVASGRKTIIYLIFFSVGLIYLIRLFYLQCIDKSYQIAAENNVFRNVIEYPSRGLIYDRKGNLLVYNEPVYDLMIIPRQARDIDTAELCKLIGITHEEYDEKFRKANAYSPYRASIFEKQLSVEMYGTLQEKMYKFKGFFVQPRTLRKYPSPIAAHLFGYIGEVDTNITRKDPYYKDGDYIGKSGIEQGYETYLRGKRGVRVMMVDVFNREKGSYMNGKFDTASIAGENLTLSIDEQLQEYGEKLLQNKVGAVVAIDPSTGEILACVSSPSYDPNLLVGRARTKNYAGLLEDPLKPLFNRSLMAYYPPGSTFKLINDLIGEQEGVLFPNTTYYCDGGYHMGSITVKCDAVHGSLNLKSAIEHSCNTYHCYVFRSIVDQKKFRSTEEGYQNWRNHVLTFGIGKRLYSDLPHELKGNVPTVAYYDKYFGKGRWKSSTVVSLSIGQGELGITPLQMANTMCIIANKGYFYVPHIVRKIGDRVNPEPRFTKKNYTDVDSSYYNIVIDGMESVVETGTAAGSRIAGIRVCGKTGTAQNPHGKDHSLFVGFAPRENPKIAIGIMVENGGWGASWAAPIASLMIEKYLNDTIKRPELEKRMLEGVVIPKIYLDKMEAERKIKEQAEHAAGMTKSREDSLRAKRP